MAKPKKVKLNKVKAADPKKVFNAAKKSAAKVEATKAATEKRKLTSRERIKSMEYKTEKKRLSNEKKRLNNELAVAKFNYKTAKANRGRAGNVIKSVGDSLSKNIIGAAPMVAILKDDNDLINSSSINPNSTSNTNPNLGGVTLGSEESIYGDWRY